MLILLRWQKGKTRVEAINELCHLGGPLGTPHERLGPPEGPQNAPKWSKSENFDLIFEKPEKSLFKAPIMVPLGECESQEKIWTNGELLGVCQGLRGGQK